MKPINVLVVGAGMYVCGRGTEGFGTILPALFQWKKDNKIGDVYVAGTCPKGIKECKLKADKLSKSTGVKLNIVYFPTGKINDKKAYLKALKEIPKPVCAIISVPDDMHKKIAGDCMDKGAHVLVVKPLTPTTKEAKELITIQNKNKVWGAVEFHKRFDLANIKLKDIIRAGRIGDPLYFVVEYSQRKSIPSKNFAKWVNTVNIFQYLGVHYVDIIYFVTGAMPTRVMALGQKSWLKKQGFNTYDSIQGIIEWKMPDGKVFSSCILANWIDPESTSAMSDQKIKVIGTKGRFESDQKKRGITIITDDKGIEEPNPYFCVGYGPDGSIDYRGYGIESVHQFLKDVRDVEEGKVKIKELESIRPSFKQAVVSTKVIEAVNKSLKVNGKWISLDHSS